MGEKPAKFEGKLEKALDDQAGNRIYLVPRRYPSLARVVESAALRSVRFTTPEPDIPALNRYVSAIERGPEAPATVSRPSPEAMIVTRATRAGAIAARAGKLRSGLVGARRRA